MFGPGGRRDTSSRRRWDSEEGDGDWPDLDTGATVGSRGGTWRPGRRQAGAAPEAAASTAADTGAAGSAGAAGATTAGRGGTDIGDEAVAQYFAAGERVLHAVLGEGTVLAVEARGIILVRFDGDGSERRLMANVAPLRKLRG